MSMNQPRLNCWDSPFPVRFADHCVVAVTVVQAHSQRSELVKMVDKASPQGLGRYDRRLQIIDRQQRYNGRAQLLESREIQAILQAVRGGGRAMNRLTAPDNPPTRPP